MPFVDDQVIFTPVGGYDDWGPVYVPLNANTLKKVASASYIPEKIAQFADQLRSRDDGRYVLLNALGAGEWYGSNKNGDYFNEWSLLGESIPPDVQEFIRDKSLPIPSEWGYKTFEHYAFPYMHHDNDDEVKSVGERVCCAGYNEKMHRVELIIFIKGEKAPEVVRKIDEGEPLAFSMGARLPFDVCSICRNAAKKKDEYCEHMKNMVNYIFPDGRKVFAYNYFPRFFDISVVHVPADRSAYALRKVASVVTTGAGVQTFERTIMVPTPVAGMEKFAELFDLLASGGNKKAEIDKVVPAESKAEEVDIPSTNADTMDIVKKLVARDVAAQPKLPPEVLETLHRFPLNKVLSGLTSLGIVLHNDEADEVIGDRPLPENLENLDFPSEEPTLINVLRRLVGSRSMFDPHFSLRIIRITAGGEGEEEPKTISLVKRGSSERYKEWLRTQVDLEKLAERIRESDVDQILFPGELEKEIVGLSSDAKIGKPDALIPFIASL